MVILFVAVTLGLVSKLRTMAFKDSSYKNIGSVDRRRL
jgi:hypothetical protein